MEAKQRWTGCTQTGNPLPFVHAIVASNPGDFGQGRVGALTPARPVMTQSKNGALEHGFMPLAQVALSITNQNVRVNTQKWRVIRIPHKMNL
jgi:hypothetical protein